MKILLSFLLITLIVTIAFAYEGIIETFSARSDGNSITVEWRTLNEQDLKKFELERSSNKSGFQRITSIDPKGTPSSYKYIDNEAYFKNQPSDDIPLSKTVFYYRIKLINKDNTHVYSNTITVTHEVSTVKRTWGMIKEMFR